MTKSNGNATIGIECLTIPQVAKVLACTTQTVGNLIRRTDLRAFKLGKAYRIEKADLIQFLAELKDDNYLAQVKRQQRKKREIA